MKRVISALAMTVLLATPALAGDWSGGYVGLGVGHGDVNGSGFAYGDNVTFGAHAGYDHDFGDYVLGGEVEYDDADISLGGGIASVEDVTRLKLRAGYDFGAALGYLVVGGARARSSVGDDTGLVYGLGVAAPIGDRFFLSGEVLHHDFNNFNNLGTDVKANTVNLRASFRF